MKAVVTHSANPLVIREDITSVTITKEVTIRNQVRELIGKDEFSLPTICVINNESVLRKDWNREIVDGDNVVFITLPQGSSAKKIFRTVLLIALVIVAPEFAPAFAGSLTAATGITFSTAVATAIILTVGGILINVLLPPPKPPTADQASSAERSPTYSLSAQGNSARLGQSIPSLYGRHLIYPDFASVPYTEYNDDSEQILFALLVVGQGYYEFDQVRIEDTPISNFEEVEWEKIEPGGTTSLVNLNVLTVVEIIGQELIFESGSEAQILGPFVVNPADTLTNQLGVDIIFPRGLYRLNTGSGAVESVSVGVLVEVRRIDISGDPIGDWVTIVSETFTRGTTASVRVTRTVGVFPSRYEIRASRTTASSDGTTVISNVNISAVRAYLVNAIDFGNITMLAVKIRATNNINNSNSRRINLIAQRLLPTWNPTTGWSERVATRSISWAIADICKSNYGGNLTDDRINLINLFELDQTWAAREDTFDGVFDRKQTIWECLTLAGRAGRALPILRAGVLSFIRDELSTGYSAVFSSRNIVQNTFSLDYVMPNEDLADKVEMSFLNESTWKPDILKVIDPEGVDDGATAMLQTFGMTNVEQVRREGIYMLRTQRLRRKNIRFQTELEGWIPNYGSPILVSYEITNWGQGGDILSVVGSLYETSIDLDWKEGKNHNVVFRKRDGSGSIQYSVTRGTADNIFILTEELDFPIDTDSSRVNTQFTFGEVDVAGVKAKIASIKPRGDLKVEIQAVEEHDEIHAVEIAESEPMNPLQTITIQGNNHAFNLFEAAGSPTGLANVRLEIMPGAHVYSAFFNSPALSIMGFNQGSQITVVNRGTISGARGIGGGTGSIGTKGGNAIETSLSIVVENYGLIRGGGGGGGGATSGSYQTCTTRFVQKTGNVTTCSTTNYFEGTGGNGAGMTFIYDDNFAERPGIPRPILPASAPLQPGTGTGGSGGDWGQMGSPASGAGAFLPGAAGSAVDTHGEGISFISNLESGIIQGPFT